MKYIITYDLRTPGKDYTPLYAAIKQLSPEWKHPLESTWVVKSNQLANDIFSSLRTTIDQNDRLLIIEANTMNMQGWMDKLFWEWIKL